MVHSWFSVGFIFHMAPSWCSNEGQEHGLFQKTFAYLLRRSAIGTDAVVERCVEQSPVTVMARLALQRALAPAWVDKLFERACGIQYTRELLFSTIMELMSVVAVGLRPSVHAAAKACKDLPVSV
jgi:hypothetical protein